jgi:uncharacterized membrane protein YdbT with pleckstrin-like domain
MAPQSPDWVAMHLGPEPVSVAVRIHPASFLGSVIMALAGLSVAVTLTVIVAAGDGIGLAVIWILWLALVLYMIWRIMRWQSTYLLVTHHRVILVSGLLRTSARAIILAQVTDVATRRSLAGRRRNYGTIIVASAGERQELQRIRFVPDLEQVYAEIVGRIFLQDRR